MSLTEILQSFESQKYCSHYLLIAEVEQPHVHWIYYYLNRQKRQSFFFSFLGNICMYSLGEGIMEQFSHGNSIPAALIFFFLSFWGWIKTKTENAVWTVQVLLRNRFVHLMEELFCPGVNFNEQNAKILSWKLPIGATAKVSKLKLSNIFLWS